MELAIERRPAVVRPGDHVQIVAKASAANACRLMLSHPHGQAVRSRVVLTQPSRIAWRWTVPGNARSAQWNASVTCHRAEPRGQRTRRSDIRIDGKSGGEVALAGTLAATVTRTARASDGGIDAQLAVSIVGLFGAALGLILVLRQLGLTRREGQADRTAQLVDRYQRLEFTEMWSRVGHGFLKAHDPRDCLTRMRVFEDVPYGVSELAVKTIDERGAPTQPQYRHATYAEVQYAANFHEEVGVLFNLGAIGRDQLIRHFGAVLVDHFTIAWWWLLWRRQNGLCAERYGNGRVLRRSGRFVSVRLRGLDLAQTDAFEEWERMVRTIVAARRDLHPDPDPVGDGQVWIVCMPQLSSEPSERYARASDALCCRADQLDALEAKLTVPQTIVRTPRILCVMRWHVYPEYAAQLQRIAGALDGLSVEELEALAGIAPPAVP